MLELSRALASVFDLRYFGEDPDIDGQVAIPFIWTPGTSKLVLVLGENSGGKSFFRRLLRLITHKGGNGAKPGPHPVDEFIHLSMEARAGDMMYGPARAMVYGDESWNSTGSLTASTVSTAISTASGRTHPVLLYWDEPDIGMSARAASGVGVAIREWVETLPEHVEGVFVTTHSAHLVAELLKGSRTPHYIYLGNAEGPKTVEAWVADQAGPFEPIRPEQVQEAGRRRFKLIQGILNSLKRK